MDVVKKAEDRWTTEDDQNGVLQFGVDVARRRDPLVIAKRRGRKLGIIFAEALGEDDHSRGVTILIDFVVEHRRKHERPPRVIFDETGPEGQRFGKELRHRISTSTDPRVRDIEIIGIQMGHPPRNRRLYDKRRDELAVKFATWLKTGAVEPNAKLEAQIEATISQRVEVSYGESGQRWEVVRIIDNDTMRKLYGWSPDERNACELAVLDVDGEDAAAEPPPPEPQAPELGAAAPQPRPRPAPPAYTTPEQHESPVGMFAQQDALYGEMWGPR
jgi:hypothetical protein